MWYQSFPKFRGGGRGPTRGVPGGPRRPQIGVSEFNYPPHTMASPNRISKGPGRVSLGAETVSVMLARVAAAKLGRKPYLFARFVVLVATRPISRPQCAVVAAGALAAGVTVRFTSRSHLPFSANLRCACSEQQPVFGTLLHLPKNPRFLSQNSYGPAWMT